MRLSQDAGRQTDESEWSDCAFAHHCRPRPDPVRPQLAARLPFGALRSRWLAISYITSFDKDPGPLPALGIVVAVLGLSGVVFHMLRIQPALQLSKQRLSRDVTERHLASSDD